MLDDDETFQELWSTLNSGMQEAYIEALLKYQQRWEKIVKDQHWKEPKRVSDFFTEIKSFPPFNQNSPPNKDVVMKCYQQDINNCELGMTEDNNIEEIKVVDKDRWLINLSQQQLEEEVKEVLQLGFKYAMPTQEIDVFKLCTEIETIIQKEGLTNFEKEVLRAKVVNKIGPHINKGNNKGRLEVGLKKLKDNRNLLVTQADKGNAIVVMERKDYEGRLDSYLNNPQLFIKLEKDPKNEYKKLLSEFVKKLETRKRIDKEEKNRILKTPNRNGPTIFARIKIHKEGMPIRPILNGTGNPVTNLAKFLTQKLNGYRKRCTNSVLNSVQFVERLKGFQCRSNHKLASLDVVNMFNSLPRTLIIEAVKWFYSLDPEITGLELSELLEGIELVLNSSYCYFKNNFYQQVEGIPMGASTSPILAELTMTYLEEKVIKGLTKQLAFYVRYVDDIFIIWTGTERQLSSLKEKMNKECKNVKFEIEKEENRKLNYLDVQVIRNENGELNTTVYRKKTYTGRTLDYNSNHPKYVFRNVAFNFLMRAHKLCNTEELLRVEERNIERILLANNYPEKVIKDAIYRARNAIRQKKSTCDNKRYTITYYKDLTENLKTTILTEVNRDIVMKTTNTIGSIYYEKDQKKKKIDEIEGCVYCILCSCGKKYIGETGRALKVRIDEHKRFCKDRYLEDPFLEYKSAVAKHFSKNTQHQILWDQVILMTEEKEEMARKLKEAFFINYYEPELNLNNGYKMAPQWYHVMKRATNEQIKKLDQQFKNINIG